MVYRNIVSAFFGHRVSTETFQLFAKHHL